MSKFSKQSSLMLNAFEDDLKLSCNSSNVSSRNVVRCRLLHISEPLIDTSELQGLLIFSDTNSMAA